MTRYQKLPYGFTDRDIADYINSTHNDKKIDRKTFIDFLLEERNRSEFDFREYFVPLPCGAIASGQHIIEDRESDPKRYDEIMDLAALAIATYNKEHQTRYKVVELEILNRHGCKASFYHITFSAVDVKGTKQAVQRSNLTQLYSTLKETMLTVLVWLIWLSGSGVWYLKASKSEIENETLTRKTFQATVMQDVIDRKKEVVLCRAARY